MDLSSILSKLEIINTTSYVPVQRVHKDSLWAAYPFYPRMGLIVEAADCDRRYLERLVGRYLKEAKSRPGRAQHLARMQGLVAQVRDLDGGGIEGGHNCHFWIFCCLNRHFLSFCNL